MNEKIDEAFKKLNDQMLESHFSIILLLILNFVSSKSSIYCTVNSSAKSLFESDIECMVDRIVFKRRNLNSKSSFKDMAEVLMKEADDVFVGCVMFNDIAEDYSNADEDVVRKLRRDVLSIAMQMHVDASRLVFEFSLDSSNCRFDDKVLINDIKRALESYRSSNYSE